MINLKFEKNNFIIVFIFVTLTFLIDRISKILIIKKSQEILGGNIFSSRFINFELIWNKGIAFGLFSLSNGLSYKLITILIIFIVIILIYFIFRSRSYEKFGLILILGGALGNLFDRIFYSAVPDFIDLHVNSYHWFIFNVADIFISIGVIIMIMTEFINKKIKE